MSPTNETQTIATDAAIADHTHATLRALVAEIVPASDEYSVPGADDELVFAEIVKELAPRATEMSALVAAIDALCGSAFVSLDEAARTSAAEQLREASPAGLAAVVTATMHCYYRDDRVMRSLGMEPRPPYPRGFELEQGDFSLLEPVRARGEIWRNTAR